MKTCNERTTSIKKKVNVKRKQRLTAFTASVTACVIAAVALACTFPIWDINNNPTVDAYKNDAYYPLIQKISQSKDRYHYLSIGDAAEMLPNQGTNDTATSAPTSPEPDGSGSTSSNKYEETTLNQVDGVIEGDILKRSTTHAFYLKRANTVYTDKQCLALDVYRLAGNDTEKVAAYTVLMKDNTTLSNSSSGAEMFLNDDATRATIIAQCRYNNYAVYTVIISLDISDVNSITEVNRVYMSGEYLSSRKVDGKLLVFTNYTLSLYNYIRYYGLYDQTTIDYSKRETYVPICGSLADKDYVPMSDIYLPENCSNISYTVMAMLDELTLEVDSKYAVYSYTQDVAVFDEYILVTRNCYYYYRNDVVYGNEVDASVVNKYYSIRSYTEARMSEIVALKYKGGFKSIGEVGLDGYVKDRYSMDVKDDVLRVFTTVSHSPTKQWTTTTNVSLYCVSLADMKVIASKEQFAPVGDEVKSARFDGDTAYVCTARRNTDPVFYFDLSDLNNITYRDTGEIAGFSHNLIKFNDLLLGIGQGASVDTLKVEIYDESNDPEAINGVVSVAKFEMNYAFLSVKYKAHFVNAEHNLIGLQLHYYGIIGDDVVSDEPKPTPSSDYKYLLLRYDEQTGTLEQAHFESFNCDVNDARAFYEHNGVYVFGPNGFLFLDLHK